jgi:hypothetical protein
MIINDVDLNKAYALIEAAEYGTKKVEVKKDEGAKDAPKKFEADATVKAEKNKREEKASKAPQKFEGNKDTVGDKKNEKDKEGAKDAPKKYETVKEFQQRLKESLGLLDNLKKTSEITETALVPPDNGSQAGPYKFRGTSAKPFINAVLSYSYEGSEPCMVVANVATKEGMATYKYSVSLNEFVEFINGIDSGALNIGKVMADIKDKLISKDLV